MRTVTQGIYSGIDSDYGNCRETISVESSHSFCLGVSLQMEATVSQSKQGFLHWPPICTSAIPRSAHVDSKIVVVGPTAPILVAVYRLRQVQNVSPI